MNKKLMGISGSSTGKISDSPSWNTVKETAEGAGALGVGYLETRAFLRYITAIKERQEYRKIHYRNYDYLLQAGMLPEGVQALIVFTADIYRSADYQESELKISNYSRYCRSVIDKITEVLTAFFKEKEILAEPLDISCKEAAHEAGLGKYGKNCLLYDEEKGSYIGIGTLGLSVKLEVPAMEPKNTQPSSCRNCRKCIEACPTGAIYPEGYRVNPLKCITFTNRHPDEPSRAVPDAILKRAAWLDGCEVCQNVCPKNRAMLRKSLPTSVIGKPAVIALHGAELPDKSSFSVTSISNIINAIPESTYRET